MTKIFPKFCESEIRNFSRNKKELIQIKQRKHVFEETFLQFVLTLPVVEMKLKKILSEQLIRNYFCNFVFNVIRNTLKLIISSFCRSLSAGQVYIGR